MKTVTIPTCANPFVVIVNGIKYTYPAGATMEVPDDVAEVIEQHEEAKTEPAPVAPPFVAVPSSGESGGASGGGGLPVVELSEAFTGNDENIALTETESAMLTNAAANKSPIVLVYNIVMEGTAMHNAVVCRMIMGMYFVYVDALTNIMLSNSEGSWYATITEEQ